MSKRRRSNDWNHLKVFLWRGSKQFTILYVISTRHTLYANQLSFIITADADQVMIGPSEVAILQCMIQGGTSLSMKAHFLDSFPDLYPVTHTLLYLNVSFNDFRTFPSKIMQCSQLVCLKMRNNPIREIPNSQSVFTM